MLVSKLCLFFTFETECKNTTIFNMTKNYERENA